jgi:hypothetical protein
MKLVIALNVDIGVQSSAQVMSIINQHMVIICWSKLKTSSCDFGVIALLIIIAYYLKDIQSKGNL